MSITPGSKLGVYEVIGLLGAGGMGEVYRALDSRLNRQVAIKVLLGAYAADAERVARFQREAQAVAALNHPRIAAIYDFVDAADDKFLVLELVEGETLAERLRRGAMPVAEAIAIAIQILDALATAHEKGICHRDLKPANLKLTADGNVKVLDFGLAKFLESGSSSPNLTQSPTLSVAGTLPGVILGTAAYMSPEQAKGHAADHRSDLFSFGCVLFEMLTGRSPFDGDSVSEILAGVIKSDVDLTALPPRLNPRLQEVLRRCLEKNPKQRWHSATDLRAELEAIAQRPIATADTPASGQTPRSWRRALSAVAILAVGTVLGGAAAWRAKPSPRPEIVRFTVNLPEDQAFTNTGRHVLALSPDSASLVYVANRQLYLRPLNGFESQPIQGSESSGGVLNPVISPDGQSVAFFSFADNSLKRIPITGGLATTICSASNTYGMSWTGEDLVFAQRGQGILRVKAKGGTPEVIIAAPGDRLLSSPQLLPGGKAVLYTVRNAVDLSEPAIVVQPIGGAPQTLIQAGSDPVYLEPGWLVYAVSGVVMGVRFDASSLQLIGEAVPVIGGVRRVPLGTNGTGFAQAAFSPGGAVAYLPGPVGTDNQAGDLAIFGGSAPFALKLPPGHYASPRVSPDGKLVAFESRDAQDAVQVFISAIAGGAPPRRLTFGGKNRAPIWSADGQWVLFQSDREGDLAIFRQRADGSGAAERLTRAETGVAHAPQSVSPDGRLVIVSVSTASGSHLAVMTMADKQVTMIAGTESASVNSEGAFSPDGRWLAFQTRPSGGRDEQTFLQPFPPSGARYLVSNGFAGHPYWSRDGKSIIINVDGGLSQIVPVTTVPSVQFGTPVPVLRIGRSEGDPATTRRNADALPDGRIVGVAVSSYLDRDIRVVTNWLEELSQRLPVK